MIVTAAELRIMLGMAGTITEEEEAVLATIHTEIEGRVKTYLGYDPQQQEHTEYYPQKVAATDFSRATVFDINRQRTSAKMRLARGERETLQLRHLPVRSISGLWVDYDGRFGQQSGAFGSNTAKVDGTDFYLQLERYKFCPTGLVVSSTSWPMEAGTVKVTYRAGYSPKELGGKATADETEPDGVVTTATVDASPIRRAITLGVTRGMNAWAIWKKKTSGTQSGFSPGNIVSERLGDYSYSLDGAGVAMVSAMTADLPPESTRNLKRFRNWATMIGM